MTTCRSVCHHAFFAVIFRPFIFSCYYEVEAISCVHDRYGSVARYWDGMSGLSVSLCDPEMLQEVGAMKLEKRVDGLNFLKGLLGPSGIG